MLNMSTFRARYSYNVLCLSRLAPMPPCTHTVARSFRPLWFSCRFQGAGLLPPSACKPSGSTVAEEFLSQSVSVCVCVCVCKKTWGQGRDFNSEKHFIHGFEGEE